MTNQDIDDSPPGFWQAESKQLEGAVKSVPSNNHFWEHGLSDTPEYSTWLGVKERCFNPTGMNVVWYAGVKMHPAWVDDPVAFIEYMGPRPTPMHSIDRFPNRHGDYEPGNVRWATWHQQNWNKDDLHWVEYAGETLCIGELAHRASLPYFALYFRLTRLGWDIERAVSTPALKHEKIEYEGKQYSLRALCREFGVVGFNTFRYRLMTGYSLEDALKTPAHGKDKRANGSVEKLSTKQRLNEG